MTEQQQSQAIPSLEYILSLPVYEQKAQLTALAQKYTDNELAEAWGTSLSRVRVLRRELGIRKGARGALLGPNGHQRGGFPGRSPYSGQRAGLAGDTNEKRFHYEVKGVGTADEFAKEIEEIQNLLAAMREKDIQYDITIRV